ncbi:hypothetical protein Bca101_021674 [Brassica carinata]
MEDNNNNYKVVTVPVALKGGSNYLLWSRLVKTAIGRLGLESHITDETRKKPVAKEDEDPKEKEQALAGYKRWVKDDLMVLSILQGSLEEHLARHGILHQTSCPYTPQTSVPKRYWGDAVLAACYLINRTPTKILKDQSPFEVLNKVKPILDHLRVFGCVCYILVPKEMRNKLEARSTKAMFIGYSAEQKGYKCFDPDARRVLISRDVKFIEEKGYYEGKNWAELEDLARPSDRATSLRRVVGPDPG